MKAGKYCNMLEELEAKSDRVIAAGSEGDGTVREADVEEHADSDRLALYQEDDVYVDVEEDIPSPSDWDGDCYFTIAEKEASCREVAWAEYLATRSGYGEAGLAYMALHGSKAFVQRCRDSILLRFDQVIDPQLPQGMLPASFSEKVC